MILLQVERMWSTVILLPLHPASLTHKNHPQRRTKVHGMRLWEAKINDVFVEYPVCVISVAVLVAVV